MSDDASYAAFLNQANAHRTQPASTQKLQNSHGLFLSSESDEPWVPFSFKSARLASAKHFADLVGEQGEAAYATQDDDVQYEDIVRLVASEASEGRNHVLPKDVHLVEIDQGTRRLVFIFTYHQDQGCYRGLRSMKIET